MSWGEIADASGLSRSTCEKFFGYREADGTLVRTKNPQFRTVFRIAVAVKVDIGIVNEKVVMRNAA